MSEEIIKILDDLGRRFGILIDWSSENILPYLQDLMSRFIKYDIAINIFAIIFGIIFLIITIFAIRKIKKDKKEIQYYELLDEGLPQFFIICISIIIMLYTFLVPPTKIIQDIYLPEKSIYEYIKSEVQDE